MKREIQCTYCRSKIAIGGDCWGVQQGVMGNERFIPLEDQLIFCSEECVHKHFNGSLRLAERIP